VLWEDERMVTEPMRDAAAGTTSLPVLFATPFEAQQTSDAASNRDIQWQLDVSARMPGVNYNSSFEVPVFKTAESRADFKLDESLAADYTAAPQSDLVLRGAGIVKEPLAGGGVRLVFPAARNWKSALLVSLFALIFGIGVALFVPMVWKDFFDHFGLLRLFMLIGFGIFFPVVWLVMLFAALDLWLYRSVVEANSSELTFRGGFFGIGRKRIWAANDVMKFKLHETMSSGKNVWKSVVIVPKNGKERTIAQLIFGKLPQQAVIDELNAALRRAENN
jgi:hypothetical protein